MQIKPDDIKRQAATIKSRKSSVTLSVQSLGGGVMVLKRVKDALAKAEAFQGSNKAANASLALSIAAPIGTILT